jgi:beta-glucosidase
MIPEAEDHLHRLLERLTLEEKVSLVSGIDNWHTASAPSIGLRSMRTADGPAGVRGAHPEERSSAVPCGIALAATWNPELVTEIGRLLGAEARSKKVDVLLGPTAGIHRTPLAGRTFESFSEDPTLSSAMAAAFVVGVQKEGVAATVKHLVGGEIETHRATVSSEIDPVALHEIYLRPFEAAVREAGVWCVMAAYNRLNGVYACENPALLRDTLKKDWGFDGVVMSDWGAAHSTVACATAGLDLEMPGPARVFGERLLGRADESTRCRPKPGSPTASASGDRVIRSAPEPRFDASLEPGSAPTGRRHRPQRRSRGPWRRKRGCQPHPAGLPSRRPPRRLAG